MKTVFFPKHLMANVWITPLILSACQCDANILFQNIEADKSYLFFEKAASNSMGTGKKKWCQWTNTEKTKHLTYDDSSLEQGYANWC